MQLLHVYVSENVKAEAIFSSIQKFHTGELENAVTKSLCRRALRSYSGFCWLVEEMLHETLDLRTGLAIHIPRDNISTDVFIVSFAFRSIPVSILVHY